MRWLETAAQEDEHLITHSYVVSETIALLYRRHGLKTVRTFVDDLLPVCEIRYVGPELHARSVSALLSTSGKRPSFVDRVTFELMREERVPRAFAFDRDFPQEGFPTVP